MIEPVPHACRASLQTLRALVWVFLVPNLSSENGKIIPAAKWTTFHSIRWGAGVMQTWSDEPLKKNERLRVIFSSFSF